MPNSFLKNAKIFFILVFCSNFLIALFPFIRALFIKIVETSIFHRSLNNAFWDERIFKSSFVFLVISVIFLCVIENADKIKGRIKLFCFKDFQENKNIPAYQCSIPLPINISLIIFSIVLVILFFYHFFSFVPMIQPETYDTLPLQIKSGSLNIINELIPTIFNLDNFEGGMYRPRVLSFLIDYININSISFLNTIFPFWGLRLPFNMISILLLIIGSYSFLNKLFKKFSFGIKLFFSVVPIYFINIQTSMGTFYRTSKFLVVPLTLFLLIYFFDNFQTITINRRVIIKAICSAFLIFLCTIFNELLVACILFLCFSSLVLSFFRKQLSINAITFIAALILYFLWYFVLGKILFGIFTPHPLLKHVHSYSSLISLFVPYNIYNIFGLYYSFISDNYKILFFALLLLLGFCASEMIFKKNYKFLSIGAFIFVLSFLLACSNAIGHQLIISLPDMKYSTYLAPSLVLFYLASIYLIFNSFIYNHSKFIRYSFLFSFVLLNLIHLYNTKLYYNIHTEYNGHLTVIQEDEIKHYKNILYFENILIANNINKNHIYLITK